MSYDIFISYRRQGGYQTAKHLYDLLSRDGYTVSFDIDTLRNGDFDSQLLRRIDQCQDFILILDKEVFARCLDPEFDPKRDWLRNELAYALEKKKNIVPIMLYGFTEFPINLPADIAQVARKNGPKYDEYYFDDFYRRLKEAFLDTPTPSATFKIKESGGQKNSTLRIKPDMDCRVFSFDEELCVAKAYEFTNLNLRKGNYILRFVSVIDDADEVEVRYSMEDNNMEDLLLVELLPVLQKRLKDDWKRSGKEIRVQEKFFDNGLGRYIQNRKYGLLDKKNEPLTPAIYDDINFERYDPLGIIKLNDKYGFIDTRGQIVIPIKYDEACLFGEELAAIKLNGKWGFIDRKGAIVIPIEYDYASSFEEGLARVELGRSYGYINTKGEKVIPIIYDNAERRYDREGIFIVKIADKWGCIDTKNKVVIPLKYDKIDCLPVETNLVLVTVNRKQGVINFDNRIIIPIIYDEIIQCLTWFKVKYAGKYGYLNRLGEAEVSIKYDQLECI